MERGIHLLPQTQRSHIRPHLVDVREALVLEAALPSVSPTSGIGPVRGPERVLFFLIDDHLVPDRFLLFSFHLSSLPRLRGDSIHDTKRLDDATHSPPIPIRTRTA